MLLLEDLKDNEPGVLIEKQIGWCQSDIDAPSIYKVYKYDCVSYLLQIFECGYDGFCESKHIIEIVFNEQTPLDWVKIKAECFSQIYHHKLDDHERFILMLNQMCKLE